MLLREIKELHKSMLDNGVTRDKFQFIFNNVRFEVVFLIDQVPFELLFGVLGHNYSFILNLKKGYILDDMPNDVFYRLCDILKVKPGRGNFTSPMFLRYFADRIPKSYSGRVIQPHEVAIYKRRNIPDAEKIYFYGWDPHNTDGRQVRNLKKTRELLGEETYLFCKKHNISSKWTDIERDRIDYYSPSKLYGSKR